MSSANVIVTPDLTKLILEREKLWVDFDRANGLARDLSQLSQQIPDCLPAALQLQFGADSIPTTELETVLPMVKEKLNVVDRLKTDVQGCYDEIESIRRKEKSVILWMVVGGAALLLIMLIVLISVISQLSS
jgi:hypothetical protein